MTTRPDGARRRLIWRAAAWLVAVLAVALAASAWRFGDVRAAAALAAILALLVGVLGEVVARLARERERDVARHADFAAAASDWFWETDADHRFVYVTPAADPARAPFRSRLVGLDRREMLTRGIIAEEADSAKWHQHFADLEAHRPFRDLVYAYTWPTGERRVATVSGVPIFDANGRFQGYRGATTDVTEAHNARNLLVDALESSDQLFALYDSDDRLVFVNSRMRRFFAPMAEHLVPGITYPEILARLWDTGAIDFGGAERGTWIAERLREHREATGKPIERRFQDGRHMRFAELPTRDGGIVVFGTDVTDLHGREDALRRAMEQARAADRAKSEFLAHMSHELRTPLNAVIGFSEMLLLEYLGPLNARQKHYVSDVLESGHHLLRLINDVLDLSKIDAGKLDLTDEAIDLPGLVEESVVFLRDRARRQQIAIEAAIAPDLPPLRADRVRLKQILVNLLANAIKFTPSGGRARIGAGLAPDGRPWFAVADTGIGMTEAEIQRALEPFGQVESAWARRFEGTGLGLPLARTLARLHGGDLEVRSTPGKGTTVTVWLPAARVEADRRLSMPSRGT